MAGWLGGWAAGWLGGWVAGRLEPPPPPLTGTRPEHQKAQKSQCGFKSHNPKTNERDASFNTYGQGVC